MAGLVMAPRIFTKMFYGQPQALLSSFAEVLKPESNCAVDVRLMALRGTS